MQLLRIDSGHLAEPLAVDEIALTPGNRADLLVTTVAGASQLRALPYNRGIQDVIHGHRLGHRHSVTAAHLLMWNGLVKVTTAADPLLVRSRPGYVSWERGAVNVERPQRSEDVRR
jgi:FtsP/CotA-like multicopper oxidase with cupredoxin domain